MRKILLLVVALTAFAGFAHADVINFDTGTIGSSVGNFYAGQGVHFSNAQFASNFGLPGSTPPVGIASASSGFQYTYSIADAIKISFDSSQTFVSITAIDLGSAGIRMDAYDGASTLLGSTSLFGTGLGVGNFATLTFSGAGIRSVKLYQPAFDGSDGLVLDNLEFSGVPEPGTMALLGSGLLGLGFRRFRR